MTFCKFIPTLFFLICRWQTWQEILKHDKKCWRNVPTCHTIHMFWSSDIEQTCHFFLAWSSSVQTVCTNGYTNPHKLKLWKMNCEGTWLRGWLMLIIDAVEYHATFVKEKYCVTSRFNSFLWPVTNWERLRYFHHCSGSYGISKIRKCCVLYKFEPFLRHVRE